MTVEFARLVERTGRSRQEIADLLAISLRTLYRWEQENVKPKRLAVRYLEDMIRSSTPQTRLALPDFRYIDLFAGIGGFRRAFDAVAGHCVFTAEWDNACRKTYEANFEHDESHVFATDIREFTVDEKCLNGIPAHDLLVAGFPCQPFSIAGVSKKNSLGRKHGFHDDTQGTLFFDIARILEHHRPAAFLLENVRNLVSHDKGRTFRIISRTLQEELGYHVSHRIIDGRSWVPQQRKRIIMLGFRDDVGLDLADMPIPDPAEGPVIGSILHGEIPGEIEEPAYMKNGKALDKYILSERLWDYLQRYREKHRAAGNGFGFGLVGRNDVARTLSARYYKDGSEILVRRGRGRPRRLTPRECARLMGFDRPGESHFLIPVSDTQAYKQFGNSVVVPMAAAIARFMKPALMQLVHEPAGRQGRLEFAAADESVV
ncbi:MAG: DNA (cytosine-5-)-methyltransferase [Gammaproteobacteria bacterium]|nr:MAG: DNA (cytosine-5-)-methyltransferase [Gammaproteobacteria bacterium]